MSKYANDGHWRAALIAAALCCAFAVAGLVGLNYSLLIGLIHVAQVGSLNTNRVLSLPFDFSDLWLFTMFACVPFTLLIPSARRARLRMRQRALALAGIRDAVPPAKAAASGAPADTMSDLPTVAGGPADAPDAASWISIHERIRLGWRAPINTGQRKSLLVGCLGLVGVLVAGVLSGLGVILLVIDTPVSVFLRGSWWSLAIVIGIPVAVMLAIGIPVWRATMRLAGAAPTPSRNENELFTDSTGLTLRRPGVQDVTLAWTEARLLEVALTFPGRNTPAWRVYTLWANAERSITWPVFNIGAATTQRDVADKPARVALAASSQQLLRLIRERTGLTAHTFDGELLANPKQAEPWHATVIADSSSFNPFGAAIFYLIGVVWPLLGALAMLTLPLTRVAWVNGCGALSLLLVVWVCLRTMLRWRRQAHPSRNTADTRLTPLPIAPTAMHADALFTLAQRPSLATTLAVWLLAPSCILDAIVALVSIILPGSSYSNTSLGGSLFLAAIAVLFTTALGGVIGLLLGVANLGPHRIVAGPERLSQGHEGAADPKTSIVWAKATAIIAITRRDGRVVEYRVEGYKDSAHDPDTISWRRAPRAVIAARSPRPLLQRAQAVTPDELAALVVARTGLTLQARGA